MRHSAMAQQCVDSYHYVTYSVNECEMLVRYPDGDGKTACVAVRGTETSELIAKGGIWDIIRDFRIYPWYHKAFGWGPCGFVKGGIMIADLLENILDKTHPIYLTGHSLGGALSLVCAAILKSRGYNVVEWVGYGTPYTHFLSQRTFDFKQTGYRYKNDIVPRLPTIWGYKSNFKEIALLLDIFTQGDDTWDDHDKELYSACLRRFDASG